MAKTRTTRSRSTAKPKRSPAKSNLPPWAWLLVGVASGLLVAFLIYLTTLQPAPKQTKPAQASPKSTAKTESTSGKFDFYTLLPDREVVNPDTSAPPAPKSADTKTSAESVTTLIQAGSFRSSKEAEQLRAELILLGLEVNIQSVEIAPGDSWHRVQVGPFKTTTELKQAKQTLADNRVEHIVIRLK